MPFLERFRKVGKTPSYTKLPLTEELEEDVQDEAEKSESDTSESSISALHAKYVVTVFRGVSITSTNSANKSSSTIKLQPYLEVRYSGMTERTKSVKEETDFVWNQQITFCDIFPPSSNEIVLLLYNDCSFSNDLIASHTINITDISSPSAEGFSPTFGPCYVHFYSTNNLDKTENVGYRGSVLVEVSTTFSESELKKKVKVGTVSTEEQEITLNQEFLLFGTIFDVTIHKEVCDESAAIALTIGNSIIDEDAFANVDLMSKTGRRNKGLDIIKDSNYSFLPIGEIKPCTGTKFMLYDCRWRMYRENMVSKTYEDFQQKLRDIQKELETKAVVGETLAVFLYYIKRRCQTLKMELAQLWENVSISRTKLDIKRNNILRNQLDKIAISANDLVCCVEQNSKPAEECLDIVANLVNSLKSFCKDSQHSLPDVFCWLLKNEKKAAFCRIPSRDIIYSTNDQEMGTFSGKLQTFFLKLPIDGKLMTVGKTRLHVWLGTTDQQLTTLQGLPSGYQLKSNKLPTYIYYDTSNLFDLQVCIYQARELLSANNKVYLNPFLDIIYQNEAKKSKLLSSTLNPVWDEQYIIRFVKIFGNNISVKDDPPLVMIEIYNNSKLTSPKLIGRVCTKPDVQLLHEPYFPTYLKWYKMYYEDQEAGEILVAFKLVQRKSTDSSFKNSVSKIPKDIRPTFSKYRIEVLFWGLRDIRKIHLKDVKKPRINVICGDASLTSSIITYAKNPNFTVSIMHADANLPDQPSYYPPLDFLLEDCRKFRFSRAIGTHTIKYIDSYILHTNEFPDASKSLKGADQGAGDFSGSSIAQPADNSSGNELEEVLTETLLDLPCYEKESSSEDEFVDWWSRYEASQEAYRNKMNPVSLDVDNTISLFEIFPCDLETDSQYNGFEEWLQSFSIVQRNKIGEEKLSKTVGVFKGSLKIYKLPSAENIPHPMLPRASPTGYYFRGVPSNAPIQVTIKVYVVKACNLVTDNVKDLPDSYLVVRLGKKTVNDRHNYVKNHASPIFGKCFTFNAIFPHESKLIIQVYDHDFVSTDDLIGETRIDLENRLYSCYRPACGIPKRFEIFGPNQWRDVESPTTLLISLSKKWLHQTPHFRDNSIQIGSMLFTFTSDPEWKDQTLKKENMALAVLHHWKSLSGFPLVPEHIETRSLFHPKKIPEQGKLEMWVDMFAIPPSLIPVEKDISPRRPVSYQLRVIIWNAEDVILNDFNALTGEKASDIYVKGYLNGVGKDQKTDIHYGSQSGEGNFNWRFIFNFDYLPGDKLILANTQESAFSLDMTELKLPPEFVLEVWDSDHFSSDDCLGMIKLNLLGMPRAAKRSDHCTLAILDTDEQEVERCSLFRLRRVRGWWPLRGTDHTLAGKIDAEFHLMTEEEATNNPAGLGRKEPDALDKPNRPVSSISSMLSPFKSLPKALWKQYRFHILKFFIIAAIAFVLVLFVYSVPGYTVKKILGV